MLLIEFLNNYQNLMERKANSKESLDSHSYHLSVSKCHKIRKDTLGDFFCWNFDFHVLKVLVSQIFNVLKYHRSKIKIRSFFVVEILNVTDIKDIFVHRHLLRLFLHFLYTLRILWIGWSVDFHWHCAFDPHRTSRDHRTWYHFWML